MSEWGEGTFYVWVRWEERSRLRYYCIKGSCDGHLWARVKFNEVGREGEDGGLGTNGKDGRGEKMRLHKKNKGEVGGSIG